ncbi:hypothetical protein D3C78_579630 [compost metagenome]
MSWKQWRAVYHAVSIVICAGKGCTVFAHRDGRRRTVVVRNVPGVVAKYPPSAGKGLKTVGFVEMASFLLRCW